MIKFQLRTMNAGGIGWLVVFLVGVILLVVWSTGNQGLLLPGIIVTAAGLIIM